MDVSNATVYDGATACAEAMLMAVRIQKKDRVLVSKNINPEYLKVIKTYAWAGGIEVELFEEIPSAAKDYACVLIQNPDFYGEITEIQNRRIHYLLYVQIFHHFLYLNLRLNTGRTSWLVIFRVSAYL